MFVINRYNHYNGKNYIYKIDNHDILLSSQFDTDLHNNDLTPLFLHRTQCMYCHTTFKSRHALFHHLGFMNIDIRHKSNYTGKFKKFLKSYSIIKKKKQFNKKTINLLAELLNKIKL